MYSKAKYRRAQPQDLDEKDSVLAGVEYNVVYLGSAVVPTYNGHGSSSTEVVVDRLYVEKYKPFPFSTKIRVAVQISSEKVSVIEFIDREHKEVASFAIETVTFCNTDIKHDRAFALVIKDSTYPSFKAYIFHCESPVKAKEMVKICNEAIAVKGSLTEVTRMRTLSSPQPYNENSPAEDTRPLQKAPKSAKSVTNKTENKLEQNGNRLNNSQETGRLRSFTDIPQSKTSALGTRTGLPSTRGNISNQQNILANQLIDLAVEEDEDEFTQLAKKRTTSCNLPIRENTYFLGNMQSLGGTQVTTADVNLLQL